MHSRVDFQHALNRNHPLNRGTVGWWLAVRPFRGGTYAYNLNDLSVDAGILNSATANEQYTTWTRPGGWGSFRTHGSNEQWTVVLRDGGDYPRFTFGCWVSFADDTQDAVLSLSSTFGNNNRVTIVNDNGNNLGVWDVNNSWLYCNPSHNQTPGQWDHVMITYNDVSLVRRIYLNGRLSNTDSPISASPTGKVRFYISGDKGTPTDDFVGWMDDVRLWKRELSPREVATYYRESRQGFPSLLNRVATRGFTPAAPAAAHSFPAWLPRRTQWCDIDAA